LCRLHKYLLSSLLSGLEAFSHYAKNVAVLLR